MPLMRRNTTIRRSRAAGMARLAGGLALPVLALGVIGTRAGIVPQAALQPVLIAGFVLGLTALGLAIYSLTDIWNSGVAGAGIAIAAIFYASPVLVILGIVAAAAIIYPRLSDITTDVEEPPVFTAETAPPDIPDAQSIAIQAEAYPNIIPHLYPLPLGDVYQATRDIVEANGWTIVRAVLPAIMPTTAVLDPTTALVVAEDDELVRALAAKSVMSQSRGGMATETRPPSMLSEAGGVPLVPWGVPPMPEEPNVATLEAIAPTVIFGFLDDVVIRLTMEGDGTRVDMRSASRLGAHDLGQNARRISRFFAKLDAALQPEPGVTPPGVTSAIR